MALSMDSVRLTPAELVPSGAGAPVDAAPAPPMPGYAPLAMPAQSFRRFSRSERRAWINPRLARSPILARLVTFGGALALTAYGAFEMYKVVGVGTPTALEWVMVVLFVITFSWVALSFTASLVGFVWLLVNGRKRDRLPDSLAERTAVVMPIYNEAPSRVFAAMQAIIEDVERTGLGGAFDYFFLSDTTDGDVWIAEERAFLAMRERLPGLRIYYRRRRKNTSRKAGNIADFVTRWGGQYAHMLVLDADSVMSGDAVVRLAAAMEADPDSGIIQSLPLIINRNTMFARLQQFAARIAGPVLAAGLAAWMGRDGNYWGHNAIIRTRAFADHCGLPDLPGRPPFGGHILSHDFVEAALIRRAGYSVYMLPTLGGSYEESPPSLIDLATRDRRWCQGNLQHARIIGARGFVWPTRQHFLTGIMGYLASPLWMAQLLVGIVLVLQTHYIRPEYFTADFSLFPAWPRFDYERALQLFILTIGILLAPKFLGLILALLDGPTRRGSGGAVGLIASTFVEIVVSAALAPIMMLIQSGSVLQILSGRDTGWEPAASRRRLHPPDQHRPPSSLARPARRHHPVRRGADLPVAGVVDVADDRRPHPVDPALLGQRPIVDRPRHAADRPPAHAGGDDDAASRRARQRARRRTRPRRPRPRRRAGVDPRRRRVPRRARSLPAGKAAPPAWRGRCQPRGRQREAQRRRDGRGRLRLADVQGAGRRARRPRADRPARPPAPRRAGG